MKTKQKSGINILEVLKKPKLTPRQFDPNKMLGIKSVNWSKITSKVRSNGKQPYAIIVGGDGIGRSIAVHTNDQNLKPFPYTYKEGDKEIEGSMPAFFNLWKNTSDSTLLFCGLKTDYKDFDRKVRDLATTVNEQYANFLDIALDWVNPPRNVGKVSRALYIWAPAQTMLPSISEEEETTAALKGKLVRYSQAGDAVRKGILRQPPNFNEVRADPLTGEINHCKFACPRHIVFKSNYLTIGNRAFAYYLGEINLKNIPIIMEQENWDVLIRMEVLKSYVYLTTVIRVEVNKNNIEELTEIDEMLSNHGKWDRLEGDDVLIAFRAFIPGSAPLPGKWSLSHLDEDTYTNFLGLLPTFLNPVSQLNGTRYLGKVGGKAFLVDRSKFPSFLITGPSKQARKTGTTSFSSLICYPPIWFPLTPEVGSSAEFWAENFSQMSPINWNYDLIKDGLIVPGPGPQLKRIIQLWMPDAVTIVESRSKDNGKTRKIDKKEIQELQEEYHQKDRILAENIVDRIFSTWYSYGRPVGLPISFKIMTGPTYRILNFYDQILGYLRIAHEMWFLKYGTVNWLDFDNVYGLKSVVKKGPDMHIGQLGVQVAINLATRIGWFISNGANIGFLTDVITQNESDVDVLGIDYGHFGLHVNIPKEDGIAEVLNPANREMITDKLNIILPPNIVEVVGRNEPTGNSTEVSTEVSGELKEILPHK